ncbi:alpha-ketoglutarate-dependent dioxygenase alkB homolog 4-like [Clavelina lepadiformis]|uniref:alpha-ketoglutarate-dependent dioxygenase alkB homolog 4-like n=1 Tax=Clavelina lepadiformis TaxID=159417 RepID=UPI004042D1F0
MHNVNHVCGCKGIRSCLLCENLHDTFPTENTTAYNIKHQKTFQYIPHLKKAVCLSNANHVSGKYVGFEYLGVEIFENFITEKEEEEICKHIDFSPWKESQSGRRKQDYGPKVNFKKQRVKFSTFDGLPSYIVPVIDRFENYEELHGFKPAEQCNLEYVPERGSQIDPHFDDSWLWGERLVTLNLLSDTCLCMTTDLDSLITLQDLTSAISELKDKKTFLQLYSDLLHCSQQTISLKDVVVRIPLKRRSVIVLHGNARFKWMHGIQREDITSRRLCCTFRELSPLFIAGGKQSDIGQELLKIAASFKGNVVL